MITDRARLCISPDATLREAIALIDGNESGIALVVDPEFRLLDTLTDGDVRRAMLAGVELTRPVGSLAARRAHSPYPEPVTAPVGTSTGELLEIMKQRMLHHVPLVDAEGRVAGLVTFDDLVPDRHLGLRAVVMAGGHGTRLRPLTEDLPKPMLPVGGRPLMERIVTNLRDAGIRKVAVTTHFRPEKIVDHFGDGQAFGVEMEYVREDRPLGTAGALGLLGEWKEPLLVINGDILTQVDFRALLTYHREHGAAVTVGVRTYSFKVPYGVVECEGPYIRALREKPEMNFFVNAGIYLLEPHVAAHVGGGERMDMTDLLERLMASGQPVVSFPIREYWLDIGQHEDYLRAQRDVLPGGQVEARS